MTVEEFFDSPSRNITGKVLLMLDLIDKEKWWSLGIEIGMKPESLTHIKAIRYVRKDNHMKEYFGL